MWDEAYSCNHEWAEIRTKRGNGSGGTGEKSVKQVSSPDAFVTDPAERATISEQCALCGAVRCELGLEPSVDLYLAHLVEVFAAIRPALRDDGVLAVNLADSFSRNSAKGQHKPGESGKQAYIYDVGGGRASCTGDLDLPEGNLLLIPDRFALAMQAAGWILRAQIVLRKANPMPESQQGWRWEPCRIKVKDSGQTFEGYGEGSGNRRIPMASGGVVNAPQAEWEPCPGCKKCEKTDGLVLRRGSWRPTRSHEFLFLFAKTENYFASGEAVREPSVSEHPSGNGFQRACQMSRGGRGQEEQWQPGSMRNARDVLDWIPDPTQHSHYAAFPPFLPAWIIQSCSPEQCCSNCGAPYAPVIRRGEVDAAHQRACGANGDGTYHGNGKGAGGGAQSPGGVKANILRGLRKREIGEHRPTCNCRAETARPVIFDPFGGSGTTGIVARDLGRDCILAELNPEYAEIARQRLASERYNPETQRNKRDRPRVGQLDLFATSVPNYSEFPNSSKDEISSQVILDSSNTCRSARRQFPPAGAPFGDGDQAVYCQSCGKRGVWYRKERQNPEGWHRSPTGIGEVCADCDPDAVAEHARTIEQPAFIPRKRRAKEVENDTITHRKPPNPDENSAAITIEPVWTISWKESGIDPQIGEQVFFTGQDGARISATVAHREGPKLRLVKGKIPWEFNSQWPRDLVVGGTPT